MTVRRSSDVRNTMSDEIITVKWSLDLSSTANEVRAFRNVCPLCLQKSFCEVL